MSAIFGVINKNGQPVDPHNIDGMQQSLMHRAIDGKGIWHSGQVFLGNHAMVVCNDRPYAKGVFEEDDAVITADALLFNRAELFMQLGIGSTQQQEYTDARLILAAYYKWGGDCPQFLNGEFAFAIWNKVSRSLFCAADHIGHRPLFYYDGPGQFIFSSEMKGILAVKKTPNIFNEEILIEYFFRQSDQARTYNSEIFALRGGRTLTVGGNKAAIKQYWQPQPTGKYHFKADSDWAECLRELLSNAVENRIRTDLPVGITLSGGLDSSSVACMAGKILEKRNKPLYAFSSVLPVGYEGIEKDERKYIGIVGRQLTNLEQVFVEAPGIGPFSDIQHAFEVEETLPNVFSYMDMAINAAAGQKGIRILLSGYGGDFFVSWKGNSVVYDLVHRYHLRQAGKVLHGAKKYQQRSYLHLVKTELVAHMGLYHLLSPLWKKNKLNWKYYTPLNDDLYKKYSHSLSFRGDPDQLGYMKELISSGRIGRLAGLFTNRDSSFGINTAMPMFDRNVLEFLLDVPMAQYRVDGVNRSLLRRAMDGILPPEIQWRKDKFPYAPDYITRLLENKQFVNDLVNSEDRNFIAKFIDLNKIIKHIGDVKPIAGMSDSSEISGIRIMQGIITYAFIQWLVRNDYVMQ